MGSTGASNKIVNNQLGAPGKSLWERFDNNMTKAIKSINPHYGEGSEYSYNCALCSVAGILSMMGYNVEAAPRDSVWRGFNSVFDFDWKNHENFVSPSTSINYSGTNYIENFYNPNKFTGKSAGVAKTIDETMQKWGTHSMAIMNVKWKDGGAHAVVVYREKYTTTIIDFQNGETHSGVQAIKEYMSDTQPTKTGLYRMDNAKIKSSIKDFDKIVVKKS